MPRPQRASRTPPAATAASSAASRPRRVTIAAACQRCRQQKLKCDGQRPCQRCQRQHIECTFTTLQDETERQAYRRISEYNAHRASSLSKLYDAIASHPDEKTAQNAFNQIRAGIAPSLVLQYLKNDPVADRSLIGERPYGDKLKFLLALVQSTLSLQDLTLPITTLFAVPEAVLSRLPDINNYRQLNGELITLEKLRSIFDDGHDALFIPDSVQGDTITSIPVERTPFWAPFEPWTGLLDTEADMSHFVSIFLTYINPYWRFVEEDAFLEDLRSGHPNPRYCSRFLVHAMLSLSALYTDHEKAYIEPGQEHTRGEHFHREAVRLCTFDQEYASILNMQALLILSYATLLRGDEIAGFSLLSRAVGMSKAFLPIPAMSDLSPTDWLHVHVAVSSVMAVPFMELAWTSSYQRLSGIDRSMLLDPAIVSKISHQHTIHWQAYPFDNQRYTFDWQAFTYHRQKLTILCHDHNRLLVSCLAAEENANELCSQLRQLSAAYELWQSQLDQDIAYRPDLPCPLVELHAHYTGLQLQLWLHLQRLTPDLDEVSSRNLQGQTQALPTLEQVRGRALHYALNAATIACDYRQRCGLKVVPGFLIQSSILAAFALLQSLQMHKTDRASPRSGSDAGFVIDDPSTALEECIRCLLASALQQRLPCKISQAVLAAAMSARDAVSDNVLQIITALAGRVLDAVRPVDGTTLYPDYLLQ